MTTMQMSKRHGNWKILKWEFGYVSDGVLIGLFFNNSQRQSI